jgi:hypothetical protein
VCGRRCTCGQTNVLARSPLPGYSHEYIIHFHVQASRLALRCLVSVQVLSFEIWSNFNSLQCSEASDTHTSHDVAAKVNRLSCPWFDVNSKRRTAIKLLSVGPVVRASQRSKTETMISLIEMVLANIAMHSYTVLGYHIKPNQVPPSIQSYSSRKSLTLPSNHTPSSSTPPSTS